MSTDLRLKQALAAMWFAYENKDGDFPHGFEEDAVREAERILGPWEKAMSAYLLNGEINLPDPDERVLVQDGYGIITGLIYGTNKEG